MECFQGLKLKQRIAGLSTSLANFKTPLIGKPIHAGHACTRNVMYLQSHSEKEAMILPIAKELIFQRFGAQD